ncbi:MAG: DUF1349 domain-containing protein [Mariniphaga sp.]|nr:DUF1349 domain-containing protein [Mariniphaga sp.]
MNPEQFYWINPPEEFTLTDDVLTIQTEPGTDFWQHTHYGFRKTNAPAFLTKIEGDFTWIFLLNMQKKTPDLNRCEFCTCTNRLRMRELEFMHAALWIQALKPFSPILKWNPAQGLNIRNNRSFKDI